MTPNCFFWPLQKNTCVICCHPHKLSKAQIIHKLHKNWWLVSRKWAKQSQWRTSVKLLNWNSYANVPYSNSGSSQTNRNYLTYENWPSLEVVVHFGLPIHPQLGTVHCHSETLTRACFHRSSLHQRKKSLKSINVSWTFNICHSRGQPLWVSDQ